MEDKADSESIGGGAEETSSPKEVPSVPSSELIEWEWEDE